MSNVFQFMPISQIAEKFPDNSWWANYYRDFNDEHLVAYYEGDLTLPFLNLDWHKPFPQQEEDLPNIEVKYMQDILQHPVIQELDPYGEENDGFWDGSKYYGFRRQAYTDEDGYCFAARIDIETPDGAFYFYTLDNEAYVSRYYQPPNHHARQDMPFLDAKRWEASERYFDRFKQFISQKWVQLPIWRNNKI